MDAAAMARDYVIDSQMVRLQAAVLAGITVAAENRATRELEA